VQRSEISEPRTEAVAIDERSSKVVDMEGCYTREPEMLRILQAETDEYRRCVEELLCEYLEGICERVNSEFNANLDHRPILEQDMVRLGRFSPPHGRLLLADYDGQIVGMACIQKIGPGVGEVTRMYVRPELRRRGIGRALLECLIEEARQIGYEKVRLDTAREWPAHSLYDSAGFCEIERYPESEVPEELDSIAVYMEMAL